jgi:hypothetical protein
MEPVKSSSTPQHIGGGFMRRCDSAMSRLREVALMVPVKLTNTVSPTASTVALHVFSWTQKPAVAVIVGEFVTKRIAVSGITIKVP